MISVLPKSDPYRFYSLINFYQLFVDSPTPHSKLCCAFNCVIQSPYKVLFQQTFTIIRKRCEICSKLTIITPKTCHGCCSDVFTVNFAHI